MEGYLVDIVIKQCNPCFLYYLLCFLIGQKRRHRADGESTSFFFRIEVGYTEANCSVFAGAGS